MKTLYYNNGKIKTQESFKNGIKEGVFKSFDYTGVLTESKIYRDGELYMEGLYDEYGKENGPWKEYHPGGILKGEGEYKNGVKTGEWKYYYPSGKQDQIGKYDTKGRPIGKWLWYHPNGNVLREEVYAKGKREGVLTEYDENGKLITQGEFIEGMKNGKCIYQLNDYREEGEYKDDLRVGDWKHYYANNNQLKFSGNYVDGLPNGKHKYYYENGKTRAEGKYIMGVKDGEWIYMFYMNADNQETAEGDPVLLPEYLIITYRVGKEVKYGGTTLTPLSDISDIQ
jgi:antitoxin component YwqK of YwqJK toxin-antitoxin module